MPLIYGEGNNAFRRLQEEIIKRSDDETIFAWFTPKEVAMRHENALLARSPSDFAQSGSFVSSCHRDLLYSGNNSPYTATNKGLRISMFLIENQKLEPPLLSLEHRGLDDGTLGEEHTLGILNCFYNKDRSGSMPLAILLEEMVTGDIYRRKSFFRLAFVPRMYVVKHAVEKRIFILTHANKEKERCQNLLAIIRPLPKTLPAMKFEKILVSDHMPVKKTHLHRNGAMSIHCQEPQLATGSRANCAIFLLFKILNGNTIILYISCKRDRNHASLMLFNRPGTVRDFRHAMDLFRLSGIQTCIQIPDHSGGMAIVSVKTRKAEHALIATIRHHKSK
jgi:hypothetical protein